MIKIHGKEYIEVNERLRDFWIDHPTWRIQTEIIEMSPETVCMKAICLNDDNRIVATGHAFEDRDASKINKTSYLENCETSACGRMLGIMGYGLSTSVASAEEVTQAIEQQTPEKIKQQFNVKDRNATEKQIKFISKKLFDKCMEGQIVLEEFKVEKLEDVTMSKVNDVLEFIDNYEKDINI